MGLSRGFTLVELMVTVAVVAILAAVAVPAMTGLTNNSRLSGLTGEMVSAVQLARSEAVRRNGRVTLCATVDGTTCANSTQWSRWIVRARDNTTNSFQIELDNSAPAGAQVSGPPAGIVFPPSGLLRTSAQITVCVPTTNPVNNLRRVDVQLSGTPVTTSASAGGQCP